MRRRLLLLAIIAMTLALCGCRLFRRSAPQPPQVQKAEIPEAIAGEEGQEPQLRVYIAEEDRIVTMNFEDYVMGVVAAEMDPEWPAAALAAQAIQARTFALQKNSRTGHSARPGCPRFHQCRRVSGLRCFPDQRQRPQGRGGYPGVAAVMPRANLSAAGFTPIAGNYCHSFRRPKLPGRTPLPETGGESLPPVCVDEDQEFWSATQQGQAAFRLCKKALSSGTPATFSPFRLSPRKTGGLLPSR